MTFQLSGHEHKYDDVRGKGFFGQTRRERRAYPEVDLEGASNEVWPKKNCRPAGGAEFGLWLRCSSVTDPLRGTRPPRALPQAKLGATHVSIIRCHRHSSVLCNFPTVAVRSFEDTVEIRSTDGFQIRRVPFELPARTQRGD